MAGLADGERGEDDADERVGLAGFFVAALTGAGVMDIEGDSVRLYSLGEPGGCVGKLGSSEEDSSSEFL